MLPAITLRYAAGWAGVELDEHAQHPDQNTAHRLKFLANVLRTAARVAR